MIGCPGPLCVLRTGAAYLRLPLLLEGRRDQLHRYAHGHAQVSSLSSPRSFYSFSQSVVTAGPYNCNCNLDAR